MILRSTQISYDDIKGLNQRLDSKKRMSGGLRYDTAYVGLLLQSASLEKKVQPVCGQPEDGGSLMESFMSRLWRGLPSVTSTTHPSNYLTTN